MSTSGISFVQPSGEATPHHGRSPLAQLIHALNQPITGLQCALELSVAGPRRPEQYIRTLREGIALVARIRVLVESIRELTDIQESSEPGGKTFSLDAILRDTLEELQPVAETRHIFLLPTVETPILVDGNRAAMVALTFRLLESALSLAQEGSPLRVTAASDQQDAMLSVSWSEAESHACLPLSRAELGLLIVQAGWERAGGRWVDSHGGNVRTCILQMALTRSETHGENSAFGASQ